ncbi:MAG: hypothetical protein ACE5OW_05390 [Candidatus Bathyarchaeia archaeon]
MGLFGKSQDSEFKKSVNLINGYLKKLDSRISPLSEKMMGDMPMASTVLSYANIKTEVAVVKPKGQAWSDMIFSAAVCPLPKENLLPFYRQLLVWNNFQTDVAHFAISDAQNAVFLVMRRPVSGLDYSEFRHIVEKISSVTLNSILLLQRQFRV